ALQCGRCAGALPGHARPAGPQHLQREGGRPGARPDRVPGRGSLHSPDVRSRAGQEGAHLPRARRCVPGPRLQVDGELKVMTAYPWISDGRSMQPMVTRFTLFIVMTLLLGACTGPTPTSSTPNQPTNAAQPAQNTAPPRTKALTIGVTGSVPALS